MTDFNPVETDHKVEEYREEKRKGALRTMAFTALVLLLLGGSIFVINTLTDTNGDLRADGRDKSARIAVLENALDSQRQQFIDCINVSTKSDRYCAATITPPADDIPDAKGSAGPQGLRGLQGLIGLRGPQGPPGLPGNPGMPGQDGADGTDGTNGTDGASGSNGANGSDGAAGEPGPPGEKGDKGDQGDPGQNGPRPTSGECNGTTGIIHYDDGSSIEVPGMCGVI